MQRTYTLLGITFIIIIAVAWYAFSRSSQTPNGESAFTSPPMTSSLTLASTAFQGGETIPGHFTCDAENVSPPLQFDGIPPGTASLVLIMDDPDIPQAFKQERGIDSFDHWTLFNIDPETKAVAEAKTVGTAGANGAGKNAYTGPCPPPEYEPSEHRYFFRLYALDTMLDLREGASKADVLEAMEGHIIEQTELMGRYKRK